MGRTARVLHGLVGEQFLELAREELPRVVGVQRADDAGGLVAALICDRLELGDEGANLGQGLVLGPQEVDLLPARVIINQDEEVLMLTVY